MSRYFTLLPLACACAAQASSPGALPPHAASPTDGATAAGATSAGATAARFPTLASVLDASQPSDWRTPDPENVLYLELATGRVVFELAPAFAPNHVANVRALVREG